MSIKAANNPFSCDPVIIAGDISRPAVITNQNGFTQLGQNITINAAWTWLISQVAYSNAGNVVINIPFAATGMSRIDYIVPDEANGFTLVSGLESAGTPAAPNLTYPNFYVTFFTVTDGEVGDGNNPIVGDIFVKKTDYSILPINETGVLNNYLLSENLNYSFVGTVVQVSSLSQSNGYIGKIHSFYNGQSIDILFPEGALSLLNGVDYTLKPTETIYFLPNDNGEFIQLGQIMPEIDISGKEDTINKSQDFEADKRSTTKYGSIKAIYDWAVSKFQALLVSGTNIKTINGESVLGSGNLEITTPAIDGNTKTFNHIQDTDSSSWSVVHNLNNKYPLVTVYDEDGYVMSPTSIQGISNDDMLISFPIALKGFATLCANENPTIPVIYDTDAQLYFNAVSTLNTFYKTAVNQLVIDLKANGLWSKIISLNVKAGTTQAEHKWNLKDPRDLDAAYRYTYTGTWIHSLLGAKSNGTTSFANTYLNPQTLGLTGNISMGVYVTEAFTNFGDNYIMGGHSGSNNFFAIQKGTADTTTAVAYAPGSIAISVPTNAKGFYAISVVSTTKRSHYETDLLEEVSTNGTGVCNVPVYEAALNLGGIYGPLSFGAGTSFIATGLTNAEMLDLRTAILNYETTLGRN